MQLVLRRMVWMRRGKVIGIVPIAPARSFIMG